MNGARAILLGIGFVSLPTALNCCGQGTLQITFDGSPSIPKGSDIGVSAYNEQEFLFQPIDQASQFGRVGGGHPMSPENGTAYLRAALGDSLMFNRTYDGTFDLLSVD
jgi:hypothetical protein